MNLNFRGKIFQKLHASSLKNKNFHISKFHRHKFPKITCSGTKTENISGIILQSLHASSLKKNSDTRNENISGKILKKFEMKKILAQNFKSYMP